jgi:hypothetical protein
MHTSIPSSHPIPYLRRGYMKYAFPKDELKPVTCTGANTLGGYALTYIDALDSLAVIIPS